MLEHELADEIDAHLNTWVAGIVERIAADVPALVEGVERRALAAESTRSLLSEFVSALRLGGDADRFHATAAALGFARQLARDGVPLAGFLRSYRLGQELLYSRAAELGAADRDTDGVTRIGLLMFRYVDGVEGDAVDAFEREREMFLRGALARRERLIAGLMAGEDVDLSSAEATLGRRLDGSHLAVIGWREDGVEDPERVATALRPLLAAIGRGQPLVLLGGGGNVAAWVTPSGQDPTAQTTARLDGAGVRVAIGSPARGPDGFVTTRRQADDARRVAALRPGEAVTRYDDISLLALLLRDPAAADAFAAEQLGELAADGPRPALLRQTLTAYLSRGRDTSATARALRVHRNTVARRLVEAERLLGHALEERSEELSVALTIARSLSGG